MKKSSHSSSTTFILMASALLMCIFAGCGGGGGNTVAPPPPGTINLKEVSCASDGVFGGGDTQCKMDVEIQEPSTTPVTYSWKSDCGGAFSSSAAETTMWTAPDVSSETQCTIEGTVSSSAASYTKSKQLSVSFGNTVSPEKMNIVSDSPASPLKLVSAEGDTYTIQYSGVGEKPAIQEGEYLIGTENGGYLKKVTSVNESASGTFVVTTEQAALADVVENGSFNQTLDFSGAALSSKLKGLKDLTVGTEIKFSLSGTTIFEDEESGVEISIPEGEISFSPSITLDAQLEWFDLKYFQASASGDLGLDLKLKAEASQSYSKEYREELARYPKDFVFFIGPVPVVVQAALVFDIGASLEANASGSVTVPTSASASVKVGAEYKNASWSPIATQNFSLNIDTPTVDLNAGFVAHAFVEPRIEIMFYYVAGPYINVHPYAEFNAQANLQEINWEGLLGAYSDAGFKVEVLSYSLADYSVRLFEIEESLVSGRIVLNQNPVISSLTATPSSVVTGAKSTLTCTASDPDWDTLTYSWTGDGGTISGSGSSVSWTSPSTEGTYTPKCEVSDGKGGTTSKTVSISVIKNEGSATITW